MAGADLAERNPCLVVPVISASRVINSDGAKSGDEFVYYFS